MSYLLVEPSVKHIAPNIALLKWATWCEQNNQPFEYVCGLVQPKSVPDTILMSCIFSYNSETYEKTLKHYQALYPKAAIRVGGAFPTNNKKWFEDKFPSVLVHQGLCNEIENLPMKYSIEPENQKLVMYASRGCLYKCKYCMVPKLEGSIRSFPSIKEHLLHGLKELPGATSVVLYDNNFTAHEYFDAICDDLEEIKLPVDIHGLHVKNFTEHHAERFARLKWAAQHKNGTPYVRFSFDFMNYRDDILRSLKLVHKHKINASFFCYLLFNWVDSPDDFWKRIVLSQQMVDEVGRSIFLFPQRYEPLDALRRNEFVGIHWDEELIKGTVRLYTFLHGFLPLTTSRNLFNWIGYSKEEFLERCRNFGKNSKYRLIKQTGTPPTTEKLLAAL